MTGAGRAQRNGVTLHFEESFEFAELTRRTHENVLAEMLENVLAYRSFQSHKRPNDASSTDYAQGVSTSFEFDRILIDFVSNEIDSNDIASLTIWQDIEEKQDYSDKI